MGEKGRRMFNKGIIFGTKNTNNNWVFCLNLPPTIYAKTKFLIRDPILANITKRWLILQNYYSMSLSQKYDNYHARRWGEFSVFEFLFLPRTRERGCCMKENPLESGEDWNGAVSTLFQCNGQNQTTYTWCVKVSIHAEPRPWSA